MEELLVFAKTQGPGAALAILVLAYFAKVLIPLLLGQIEKLTEAFRSDMAAARKDFRDEMASERTANAGSLNELASAIRDLNKCERDRREDAAGGAARAA